MQTVVPVQLGERSYEVHVGEGLLPRLGELLRARVPGRRVIVVTDREVGPLYGNSVTSSLNAAGFETTIETLSAGEATKSLESASYLYDRLIDSSADRQSVILALGGGVIGDLAGFVAATYARGIAFAQAPTSLLAMVDASVGGKVGVDHPKAKNIIGAFHQPVLVVCDLKCLKTLPERQFRCGLAEIVKYGVILDEEFFVYLEENAEAVNAHKPQILEHLVAQSCRLKARVVEQDERELTGVRAVLNYGHTFAHAFETAGGYELLQHGEAVAIGMICAGLLAEKLGRVGPEFTQRQIALWTRLGLPTKVPRELLNHDLLAIMRRDKKAQAGKLRFVLPTKFGHVELVQRVDEETVERVLLDAASD